MFTQSLGGGFMLLSPENWRAAKPFLNSCKENSVENMKADIRVQVVKKHFPPFQEKF